MTEKDLPLTIDEPQDEGQSLPAARTDLEITEQVYFGKPCYVVKDPTTLRYYRLRPPEYTIFTMLDGKTKMENILQVLAERFPSEQYDGQAVMNFIIMLRGASLLRLSGSENTEYLLKRKQLQNRSLLKKIRTEFLFYRIPIIDPDKLLTWLHAKIGNLIYNRITAFFTLIMFAGAIMVLLSNIDKLSQRQPLLSWTNMLYLAPALLLIKLIHEFGHGLTSKHFGSEVHEMGILFLVFTPCFYCDVSDAWMISEKRKRMWITAAGIAVEVILAALATYVWGFTEPKTVINQFALNIMIAASVNTIMFNGNPLLRYDGYYFVMDLVEIPNLKQKGSGYLWYLLQRFVLGVENASEPIDVRGREVAVLGYAICSAVYRWFIMIAIIMLVWRFLDPYGWGVIGGLLAIGSIYTAFAVPVGKFIKFIYTQYPRIHIRLASAVTMVLLIAAAVYGILILPVEQTVQGQCIIRPANLHPVYVSQAGFICPPDKLPLHTFVRDGQHVKAGQILLVLSNPELEHKQKDISLHIKQLQTQKYQALQQGQTSQAAQIERDIESLQAQNDRLLRDLHELTIRSPADGILQLRTNAPLNNMVGQYLPVKTELFAVYPAGKFEAVMAVNHRDIELIKVKKQPQKVEIKLWARDNEILNSTVISKPPAPVLRMSSPAFSTAFHGEVPTMPAVKATQALIPAENTYEMILPLPKDNQLRDGMEGQAKIIVEKKTLGRVFYLWLLRTLRQDIRL